MLNEKNKDFKYLEEEFIHPEALPSNDEISQRWQKANKSFWEKNSMRYDWDNSVPFPEFSPEFYNEIDKRFLSAVYSIMPWQETPFEQWIDLASLPQKDVLEIGTGNGTHAQILAGKAKTYTGIDLTEYAVKSASTRLALHHLNGTILQMDAEHLDFPSSSFDFVWSWGVIHHSSNTGKILNEIHRVLRPGGKTVIMVYYRSWWSYTLGGVLLGMFKGSFFKGKSLHQINQSRTDGALARYYTFATWRKLVKEKFKVDRLETLGNKGDIILLGGGKLKTTLLNLIPTPMTILFLKNFRMGSFLICEMSKK